MPVAPTLHAFDPQIAGKFGFYIDPPAANVLQIIWYVGASAPGGPYTQIAQNSVHTGFDGRYLIIDGASATLYWAAKVLDSSGGLSAYSNEVPASPSAGPPTITQVQHLQAALGGTYSTGDIVEVFPPTPTLSKSVNADGSIS